MCAGTLLRWSFRDPAHSTFPPAVQPNCFAVAVAGHGNREPVRWLSHLTIVIFGTKRGGARSIMRAWSSYTQINTVSALSALAEERTET